MVVNSPLYRKNHTFFPLLPLLVSCHLKLVRIKGMFIKKQGTGQDVLSGLRIFALNLKPGT